ncbi:MAG TPA: DUF5919 domain-containing protein [Kribbellaceae bacterium]|jgi:transcriptional regulator with XRE-family HTH domain
MPNERLRGRIAHAGLTIADVASKIEVDPKTVERWITKDRVPHRRHRWATAQLLDTDEAYLWPEVVDTARTKSASEAELVSMFQHRGAVPQQLWSSLIDAAQDSLEILVYAGLFLFDGHPDLSQHLADKAHQGTKVRILFGDPDSDAVANRGAEEGIGDGLAARIRTSIRYLNGVHEVPGVDVRLHDTILYNSLYRFDDDLLVNLHAYGTGAPQNPVMHLRRVPGGRLFNHYMTSFDAVWDTAKPLIPARAA